MLFRNERMLPFRVQREDDSLLTLPRTLYYCLGNIESSGSIRSDDRDSRGNVPFASGLVHLLGNSELVIPQARVQKQTPEVQT